MPICTRLAGQASAGARNCTKWEQFPDDGSPGKAGHMESAAMPEFPGGGIRSAASRQDRRQDGAQLRTLRSSDHAPREDARNSITRCIEKVTRRRREVARILQRLPADDRLPEPATCTPKHQAVAGLTDGRRFEGFKPQSRRRPVSQTPASPSANGSQSLCRFAYRDIARWT